MSKDKKETSFRLTPIDLQTIINLLIFYKSTTTTQLFEMIIYYFFDQNVIFYFTRNWKPMQIIKYADLSRFQHILKL